MKAKSIREKLKGYWASALEIYRDWIISEEKIAEILIAEFQPIKDEDRKSSIEIRFREIYAPLFENYVKYRRDEIEISDLIEGVRNTHINFEEYVKKSEKPKTFKDGITQIIVAENIKLMHTVSDQKLEDAINIAAQKLYEASIDYEKNPHNYIKV